MSTNQQSSKSSVSNQVLATRLSLPPSHHFFGFHDICAWNYAGDKVAALRVSVIDRPPTGTDVAEAGFVDETTGNFTPLVETTAYNFPQGARQLWTPHGGFWVNVRVDDHWGAVRVAEDGTKLQTIEQALYAISCDGTVGWGLNFARMNRLAGYGYTGLADRTAKVAAPETDGIWEVDLATGATRLLLSIRDVAAAAGGQIGEGHHYLTHMVPSPSNHRLLFLHRYWLGDGGLHNRLMSIRPDGSDLRCHAEGFLSHFDWHDDQRVVIWGRAGARVDRLRRHPLLQIPGVRPLARIAKRVVKLATGNSQALRMYFLEIDIENDVAVPIWPDILQADGHPMFCPANRQWMIVDTYPDADGVRPLMLLNVATGRNVPMGRYPMLHARPDTTRLQETLQHVDPHLVKSVGAADIAFWRSGLHCDLHPRWKADGTAACFDSIHEGTRQMYRVDTSSIVQIEDADI